MLYKTGQGLSPRVRGNLKDPQIKGDAVRSIPARAGNLDVVIDVLFHNGSIPARAGEPRWPGSACRRRRRGSIPARAGGPVGRIGSHGVRGVYPRACGGTRRADRVARCPGGLSPRVRGNPGSSRSSRSHWRSIPARAGEPPVDERSPHALRGLSPRVRGNRWRFVGPVDMKGSIPARAGNPWSGLAALPAPGLSPRVRGNPATINRSPTCDRSIPARAGEPRSGR